MKCKWFLLAVLLAILAGKAHAQEPPVSITEYTALLNELATELQKNPSPTAENLADLAARIDRIELILLPDGESIPVDSGYLTGLLQSEPPDTDRLLGILESYRLLESRGSSYSAAEMEAVHTILAQPEFQWPEEAPNPLYELWQRFMNWLLRLLDRIFPTLDKASPLINAGLFSALAIILVLVFRFIYRNSLKSLVRDAGLKSANGALENLTSEQAAVQARHLSRLGDRRSAVRYLYLSALIGLEENGFLRTDRTRTNHEFLSDLVNRPDILTQLETVTETFDRVWYGFHPIDAPAFEVYGRQVEQLKSNRRQPG